MYRTSIKGKLIGFAMIAAVGISGMYAVRNSYETISHNVPAYTENTNKITVMHKAKTNDTKIKDDVICTEPLDIVQSTETTEINKNAETDVILNEDEINILATLVNLEAGIESYECQKDVASVVINRMMVDNLTLEEVIYADNQFSPAYMISDSEPTETSLKAVNEVIEEGTTLPVYVTYFRSGRYHQWGDLVGYIEYDNTYFSYDYNLKEMYENGNL